MNKLSQKQINIALFEKYKRLQKENYYLKGSLKRLGEDKDLHTQQEMLLQRLQSGADVFLPWAIEEIKARIQYARDSLKDTEGLK